MSPEDALNRAAIQGTIFADRPRRLALAKIEPTWPRRLVSLLVHRAVPAEYALRTLAPFAAYAGLEVRDTLGDYDDTLSFGEAGSDAFDVELVWQDFGRYTTLGAAELAQFVSDRLAARRRSTTAPLLVMDDWGAHPDSAALNIALRERLDPMAGVFVCPLSELAQGLGGGFLDTRDAGLSGTAISVDGYIAVARELGLQWLPAALGQDLKGVAVDLDHTLYAGVLGEDGPDGVVLTAEHADLQRAVLALKGRGFFVAIISRNEAEDVRELFAKRSDFPLQAADVDAWGVSWGAKADAIATAAAQLRISPDAMLFIDDNAGELAATVAAIPGLNVIHAGDPAGTTRALTRYPGLFRFRLDATDALRSADLAANTERTALAASAQSDEEYLAALAVQLQFRVDHGPDLARLAQISNKTNQFNTALARFTETDVAQRIEGDDHRVFAVSLSDRLTDSGTIAFVSASRTPGRPVLIEEVCVSCRALGRGLEKIILDVVMDDAARWAGTDTIELAWTDGPRNGPAREWAESVGDQADGGRFRIPPRPTHDEAPVKMTWETT